MRFNAFWTQSADTQTKTVHLTARKTAHTGKAFSVGQDVAHVQDGAAPCTDKVGMRFRYRVKALLTVDDADADDSSLLLENGEIAVNCAEAEIRIFGLEAGIQPFGAGMLASLPQSIKYCLPLAAVLSGCVHAFHLFLITRIITKINIAHVATFVKGIFEIFSHFFGVVNLWEEELYMLQRPGAFDII